MPKKLSSFGLTPAINNKFFLVFGGFDVTGVAHDEISIYSVLTETFRTSKIKCPTKGDVAAITINNKEHDEMAVFGYIRHQWKVSAIPDHYFPPQYLLRMMSSYYLTETIHLMDRDSGEHWKMSSLDII